MRRTLLAIIIALVVQLSLFAQTSAITGTVSDEGGNPLSNAAIQAADVDTNNYYHTTSSLAGDYTVGHLPVGTYYILVETNIGRYTKAGIIVSTGETVRNQ